jgi:hypothetical protein
MKIEFTKKQLIVAVAAVAVIAITAIISFHSGFSSGVESTENPKGNGEHFYMECFDEEQKGSTANQADLLLYHSTLECPNIRYGTERDGYGYYKTWSKRRVPYIGAVANFRVSLPKYN